ncbi:HupE/UreJ family protein [uncultured Aquincola sp.]|uniref:HupE/UreJ family protein n=1 Tax=uncultured Aquincola sp. TaxID=886556 RepID=UPI0032B2F9D0
MRPLARTLAATLALGAGAARAHSPIQGVGDFYGGMLHPLLVPAHLIALIAVGLWLAQQRPVSGRALSATLLAVPLGMVAAAIGGWQNLELPLLAVGAAVALAVALARELPWAWRAGVGAWLGALLGADSLPDGLRDRALWMSLGGTWLSVFLVLALVVALSDLAVRPWMKIGLRVLASWLAAAALLVLALAALGPTGAPGSQATAAAPSCGRHAAWLASRA